MHSITKNCSDLLLFKQIVLVISKFFQISSRSLEQLFLTVGQNNFVNKIPNSNLKKLLGFINMQEKLENVLLRDSTVCHSFPFFPPPKAMKSVCQAVIFVCSLQPKAGFGFGNRFINQV
jgi:hypothetical protein